MLSPVLLYSFHCTLPLSAFCTAANRRRSLVEPVAVHSVFRTVAAHALEFNRFRHQLLTDFIMSGWGNWNLAALKNVATANLNNITGKSEQLDASLGYAVVGLARRRCEFEICLCASCYFMLPVSCCLYHFAPLLRVLQVN